MALVVLGIGGYGASLPLLPKLDDVPLVLELGDEIPLEEFNAPAEAAPEAPQQPEVPEEIPLEEMVEELEIPPVPTIEAPLSPPEMAEILPLDTPPPAPAPVVNKPKPKPAPERPRPVARRAPPSNSGTGGSGSSATGSGSPTLFRGGSGRFPHPSYPFAARKAGAQGTVRLLVVVEISGLPGSVVVQSSSGHAELDSAAQDHVRRRWRWPAGEVRRYIVPVRFVLR